MSAFKERLKWLRANDHRDHDDVGGLLVLAEGLAEVIALLRPLVDTVTAQSSPLTPVRHLDMCLAVDPGSNGFRRCMEPYGHDGDHRHRDGLNAGVEYAWTQRHGDVPPDPHSTVCGAEGPRKDHGAFGVHQYVCRDKPGHVGNHSCTGLMGALVVWP